jgi:hypothetical protein
MRHSFDVVITITAGSEDEHWACVTGEYFRAQPAYAPPGENYVDPPESAAFEVGSVTVEIGGIRRDFLPFMTDEQIARIEEEGVNDFSGTPRP